MKPPFRILCLLAALAPWATAQKISELPAITGAEVNPAADVLPIVDTSAGASGNKKITIAELVNVSSFTSGNFLAANSVEFAQVNGLTAGINGKASVDGSNIADPEAFRAALNITPIRRVVALGTSITNAGSDGSAAGLVSTRAAGFLPAAQVALGHRFTLARRSNGYALADVDFGYDGFSSAQLLSGNGTYFPLAEAIETRADAIVIEAGANDTGLGAAAMATAITALWDRAIPNFERVFAINVLPQGAINGDRRTAIEGCNALLVTAAASRPKVVLVDAWSVIAKTDGYATTTHMHTDLVHPNSVGGMVVGAALAEAMRPYCHGPGYQIPEDNSPRWLTSNRLKKGSATLPTGWVAGSGSAISYQAIDETASGGMRWQRFLATPATPSTFHSPYQLLTPQCEAVYANAANTNAGTATVTVTHAKLRGSPLAVSFEVTAAQSQNDWTAAARAALNANVDITTVFSVTATAGFIPLVVKVPDRTDSTFAIAIQLPGVGAAVGWQRWTATLYSPGGYRAGDVVRATARLRTVAGLPVTTLAIAARVYVPTTTTDAAALGYPASVGGTIPTVDGLYLSEPFEVPAGATQLYVLFHVLAPGACAFDARDVGIFRENQ